MNIKNSGILDSRDKCFQAWILRPFGAQDDNCTTFALLGFHSRECESLSISVVGLETAILQLRRRPFRHLHQIPANLQ